MKHLYMLLTLAVLVAASNSEEVQEPGNRGDERIFMGWIQPGDTLLQRTNLSLGAIPNAIQTKDFVYQGGYISAINVYEVGRSQYAVAYIVNGGIGSTFVTIRLQTARGYGCYFNIEIWGRRYK